MLDLCEKLSDPTDDKAPLKLDLVGGNFDLLGGKSAPGIIFKFF
jgi:hypothetical protein